MISEEENMRERVREYEKLLVDQTKLQDKYFLLFYFDLRVVDCVERDLARWELDILLNHCKPITI